MPKNVKKLLSVSSGFTLIETVIYLALLVFLIGSGYAAAYSLIESSQKNRNAFYGVEEGNFLLRKIEWAMTDVSVISDPASGSSVKLSVKKNGFAQNIDIKVSSEGQALLSRDGGVSWLPLTSDPVYVKVSSFSVKRLTPDGIEATFQVNGRSFEITRYIKQ